jgi:hypothetical protein
MHIGLWWERQKERGLEHKREDDDIVNLRVIWWSGFIWFRIGTSGGLL